MSAIHLAKRHLDVGLFCSDVQASRAFYEGRLGLAYEELLKVGGGIHQHRVGIRGAVLKLNSSRSPLPADRPSCLRGLLVADPDAGEPVELADPDGLPVTLVPPGHLGVETVGIRWATSDPERLGRLLAQGLGAEPIHPDGWRVGTTALLVESEPAARHDPERAIGFGYLTVQVHDVAAEHERLLSLGWVEDRPPVRLGDVAAISFVRDPDGTLLEISQRASLTGPLTDL